MFVAGQLYS